MAFLQQSERKDHQKYYQLELRVINSDEHPQNRINFQWHRVIYTAFNEEIPDGRDVHHINSCPEDNRLKNLVLPTSKQNKTQSRHLDVPPRPHRTTPFIPHPWDDIPDCFVTLPPVRHRNLSAFRLDLNGHCYNTITKKFKKMMHYFESNYPEYVFKRPNNILLQIPVHILMTLCFDVEIGKNPEKSSSKVKSLSSSTL